MSHGQQSGMVADGVFDFGRENGAPTYYDENQTSWQADILEAGLISAGVILLASFYSILPGVHGKERFSSFIWITASVFVGVAILVVNYSKDWETATISSTITKYKAGTGEDIRATIGVHIGLTGVNVTLKGEPVQQLNETINYNEEYAWTWRQGRIGFGPFASEFNQEYRASQFRGVPLPILWVAEYFTFDGEGIRWGRFYRVAGLYSYMCLWLAFGLWLLTNVLCFILLRYAAYTSILTGAFMCTANIIKYTLRNVNELEIPFSTDHILKLNYGIAFWICLGTGCFCILAGVIVLLIDLRAPIVIARFFMQDHLQDERFIDREGTIDSQTSGSSTNTELTEIVEVDAGGNPVVKIAVRPVGANQDNARFTGPSLDDVYGDVETYWSDVSNTDTDSSEDELSEPEPKQPKQRGGGILNRFQRTRRPTSAVKRTNNLKSHRPTVPHLRFRGRVSPKGQTFKK